MNEDDINIKRLRKFAGLTQAELASTLDVTRPYLSQLEAGREPSVELRKKIREVVFVRLLTPLRREMSDARREDESREVASKLEKIFSELGPASLSEQRVLTMIIDDSNVNPAIIPGDMALSVYHKGLLKLDLILLDECGLDNVLFE